MTTETDLKVVKEIEVGRSAADAFRIFTEEITAWWPLATHSIYEEDAVTATIEPRVGGRISERTADGREADWGAVTVWDPPSRFAVTWKPNLDDDAPWTAWSVSFDVLAPDRTRVTLTHTGWEAHGDRAAEVCAQYESGWNPVLASFAAQTAP